MIHPSQKNIKMQLLIIHLYILYTNAATPNRFIDYLGIQIKVNLSPLYYLPIHNITDY